MEAARRDHDIFIVVNAHNSQNLRMDAFEVARDHAVRRTTRKVVVISCLTHVPLQLGGKFDISMVGESALVQAMSNERNSLLVLLSRFRSQMASRQIAVDIQVRTGRTTEAIVLQAAEELSPRCIIIDSSFSGYSNRLQQELGRCNLVFIRAGPEQHVFLYRAPDQVDTSPEQPEEGRPRDAAGVQRTIRSTVRSRVTNEESTSNTSTVNCCNGWFSLCRGSRSTSSRTLRENESTTRLTYGTTRSIHYPN